MEEVMCQSDDEVVPSFSASVCENERLMGEPQSIVVKVEITSPPPSPLSDDSYLLLPNALPTPIDNADQSMVQSPLSPEEYILSDTLAEERMPSPVPQVVQVVIPSAKPVGTGLGTDIQVIGPNLGLQGLKPVEVNRGIGNLGEGSIQPSLLAVKSENPSVPEKKNEFPVKQRNYRRTVSNSCFAKMESLLSATFRKQVSENITQENGLNQNIDVPPESESSPAPKDSLKPFKCRKCRKSYCIERHLRNHVCNPGSLVCDMCGETLPDIVALEEHQATVPCGTCKDCGKEFTEANALKAHKLLSHAEGASYKCSLCKVSFNRVFSLTNHIRKVHSKKTFECDTCGKILPDEKSLETHQTENTCAKCAVCGQVFLDLSEFRAHRLSGHESGVPSVCDICKATFQTITGLNNHIRKAHKPKTFDCPTCGKKLPDPESLQAHESEHACVKCYDCGKEYLNVSALKAHRLLTHIEGAEHKCPMCPTSFEKPHGLICHIRKVHNEQNPYICTFCGSKFPNRPQLKSHLWTHKRRPFPCEECGVRFTSKSGLLTHQRRVHVKDKPYACTHCNKSFVVPSYLQNHVNYVHNPERALKWQARLDSISSENQSETVEPLNSPALIDLVPSS